VWVGDGICDILKCGAKFCEGERVIVGREVGVYLSIILYNILIFLLTISLLYYIIIISNKTKGESK
jgi:hypothetical protein